MKKNISLINVIDILVYALVFGLVVYAKYLGTQSFEAFYEVVKEDGIVEYLTAFFLFAGAVVFAVRAVKSAKRGNIKQLIFNLFMFVLFIFGTGEEISWGQRLFDIQSSEYFIENNYQKETNLHNLVIGGVDLNILIFSKLMFIALVFYFIILGILTWKWKFFRKLVLDFGVPVPRLHHIVFILVVNILVTTIHLVKESELHELVLAGVLFLVFLNPAKKIKQVRLTK